MCGILAGIALSNAVPLYAQKDEIGQLQKNIRKLPKIIRCSFSKNGCSQVEIDQARLVVGAIVGALLLGGGVWLYKRRRKEGPIRTVKKVIKEDPKAKNIFNQGIRNNHPVLVFNAIDMGLRIGKNEVNDLKKLYEYLKTLSYDDASAFKKKLYDTFSFKKRKEQLIATDSFFNWTSSPD